MNTHKTNFAEEWDRWMEQDNAERVAYEAAIADSFGAAEMALSNGNGDQLGDFFGSGLVLPEAAFLTIVLDRHRPIDEQCKAILDRMIELSMPLAEASRI